MSDFEIIIASAVIAVLILSVNVALVVLGTIRAKKSRSKDRQGRVTNKGK